MIRTRLASKSLTLTEAVLHDNFSSSLVIALVVKLFVLTRKCLSEDTIYMATDIAHTE